MGAAEHPPPDCGRIIRLDRGGRGDSDGELSSNQIDDPELWRRGLGMLADDLGELDRHWLPLIEQSLARARKSTGRVSDESEDNGSEESDESSPLGEAASRQLRDAEDAQASARAVLAESARLLGGWRQRFHLSSELDALLADQKQVQQETNAVGRETLAKAASRLSAQQQADLARLSDRQRRLATRLDQFLEPPDSGKPSDDGGETASWDDARAVSPELLESQDWLREQGTAGEMHRAAESLKRNEIPAAARAQENVLAALRDFGERLHQTPFNDPETLLSESRDASEEAETLRKEQEKRSRNRRSRRSSDGRPAAGGATATAHQTAVSVSGRSGRDGPPAETAATCRCGPHGDRLERCRMPIRHWKNSNRKTSPSINRRHWTTSISWPTNWPHVSSRQKRSWHSSNCASWPAT